MKTLRVKLASAFFAGILSISSVSALSSVSAVTEGFPSVVEQVFEVCQYQSLAEGIKMTDAEKEDLMTEIDDVIRNYAEQNRCTYDNAGKDVLAELVAETEFENRDKYEVLPYGSSGKGTGEIKLPEASKGDIFFIDNNMPWNHVGIYVSKDEIIEAMPEDGVKKWSIDNPESYQAPTGDDHNQSCVLRVKNITSEQIDVAVNWAMSQVKKSYDSDFVNNKADTEKENKKLNCSELVWKAYKFGAGIDLDNNGGLAVYPNNIYDSDKLTIVAYISSGS